MSSSRCSIHSAFVAATLPETAEGGIVVLACVPGNGLGWLGEQHDRSGTLVAATALTNHRLWWNALAPAGCAPAAGLPVAGSLGGLGLLDPESTVDDWGCGGRLRPPGHSHRARGRTICPSLTATCSRNVLSRTRAWNLTQ